MTVWQEVLLLSDGDLLLLNEWARNGSVEKLILYERIVDSLWLKLIELWWLIETRLADLIVHGSLELCLSNVLCRSYGWLFEKGNKFTEYMKL